MKLKKSRYLLMAALIASSIGLSACGETQQQTKENTTTEQNAEAKVQSMKGEELNNIENDKKEKEKYLVVDVRSADEYKQGHLKFAINIPIDSFEKEYKSIDSFKDKDVVLYCNSGKKSGKAADILVKNGFNKVYNAEGVKQFKYDLVTYANLLGPEFQKAVDSSKDATVIDARDEADFKAGAFKGALNINPDTLKDNLSKLPKDKNAPIFVYCYTGNKSAKIANMLTKEGYTNVTNAIDGSKEYEYNFTK